LVGSLAADPGVELALDRRLSRWEHRGRHEETERLRAARLDVLVDLTGTDLPGAGTVARYGVWSFHHGDGEAYAPGPMTRWEPHCGGPVLHVALLATVGQPVRRLVLQSGCFAVRAASWKSTLDDIFDVVAAWPAKVCRETCRLSEDPLARGREPRFRGVPGRRGAADFPRRARRRLAELGGWLRRQGRRWRRDQWAIGIVRAPIHAFLAQPSGHRVTWLAEPSRGAYLADPFAARSGAASAILVERFDRRTRLGELCALERADGPDGHRLGRPRPVLPVPVHVSYPFLFEDEGRVYCLPEMFQSGGAHLFEALEFPTRWRFVATLLEDFPAVDPTLFRHGGRFWLLCTSGETSVLARTALHAWWATVLTGPWMPHARNPVKFDARSARPAGTPFEHDGQLFRPSQDCSETYGGAVRVNRITRLTPEEYEEETVAVVRPDPNGPYPAGLHTLSAFADKTLIDGKRWVWCLPWAPRSIGRHPGAAALRPALGRLRG
jgi:hypothetical protein